MSKAKRFAHVTVVLRADCEPRRVPYRLARYAWHLSSWLGLLGEWLDELADRGRG